MQPVSADLSGKVAIVTGATSGIGRVAAHELARMGAKVVLPSRDPARGQGLAESIRAAHPEAKVELFEADLSSQASIHAFTVAFLGKHTKLDILVNNAGIFPSQRELTREKIELTWATNVLAYYLMIELLKEVLAASGNGRIINVASQKAGSLDLGDVEFTRRPFNGNAAYEQSKQADRMMTWALARRLEGTPVNANAVHPGFTSTELFRRQPGLYGAIGNVAFKLFGRSPALGADTVVWLAASPDAAGQNGKFWADRKEIACAFRDQEQEEKLWSLCRTMIGAI